MNLSSYVCQNYIFMKKGIVLVGAMLTLLVVSCGGKKTTENASENASESAAVTKLLLTQWLLH